MKPSTEMCTRPDALTATIWRFRAANARVSGSVLHGTDVEGSDLDMLIDPLPNTTLFDLGALQQALEEALGVPVDVRTPGDLPERFCDAVLSKVHPLRPKTASTAGWKTC